MQNLLQRSAERIVYSTCASGTHRTPDPRYTQVPRVEHGPAWQAAVAAHFSPHPPVHTLRDHQDIMPRMPKRNEKRRFVGYPAARFPCSFIFSGLLGLRHWATGLGTH